MQIFNPITELVIPKGTPTKEAIAKIELQPVKVEDQISNCLTKLRFLQVFLCFLIINFVSFIQFRK